jgi:hypothetical protein
MNKMNPVVWVEVPVSNMDRAIKCYNTLFDWKLEKINLGGLIMAWFPGQPELHGSSGSLVQQTSYVPSQEGPLIYFNCADVQIQVDRLAQASCTLIRKKTQISEEHGYMALAIDTEGNRIAFHSAE